MKGYTNPQLLCTATELAGTLEASCAPGSDSAMVVLLDLRAAEAFAAAHVPGAVHLDLYGLSLIDTSPEPLRAFLWMIEHLLIARGVSDDRAVVVYDEHSGIRAARAFWCLEYFGHPATRLLDGGFRAWERAGLPVTSSAEAPRKGATVGRSPIPDRLATWSDVRSRLGTECVMLDTRGEAEYLGDERRAARGGAIPGAVHIEWTRNLDDRGEFKSAADLRGMYESAGVTPDREIVAYCQGGYRAAHSYLALRLLGYERVRSYLGSWKEWGDRDDLPVERPSRRR